MPLYSGSTPDHTYHKFWVTPTNLIGDNASSSEKRILLNDPDLIQSQIHALERKVEDVVAKNTDLSTKYTDLTTKYNDLFAKYNTLLTKTNDGGVFVRWGRKDCPGNNTELVYSENEHDYLYDKNAACPPAPSPVDVPDVALHLDVVDHDSQDVRWYDGRTVVEIKHLADQLYCCKCRSHLHLSDIVNGTRYGLGSVFNIICKNDLCCHTNQVSTGKRNSKGAFDINTKVAIS
uniref:Mutator-like transposase domain-containing protein n=1 Tax=Magallana gigas TaxID=29159 RepID=K1R6A8_MAGGI